MKYTRVARRYARALLELATEKGEIKKVREDMDIVFHASASAPEMDAALANPVLPSRVKESIVRDIFEKHLGAMSRRFIAFLSDRNRLAILSTVAEIFLEMEKEQRGIVDAELVSAMPMDKAQTNALRKGLDNKFGRTFMLNTSEDRGLIGGFTLAVKDRVYDFSIRQQLETMKKQLTGK